MVKGRYRPAELLLSLMPWRDGAEVPYAHQRSLHFYLHNVWRIITTGLVENG
ncbi:hypothetical protein [Sodalis-like endosymbiont of Proechinophthirus fluctus]|uniref:hypothetical protein n=1 Tax=Sodalis-like endosymbiont of Proechinophthirus fluctus TaxID=1462730 RepID=UPI000A9E8AAD|nr:hypothetical protein [Sodalis-like endosymbiont of Proechinophthirus fluctus]